MQNVFAIARKQWWMTDEEGSLQSHWFYGTILQDTVVDFVANMYYDSSNKKDTDIDYYSLFVW